MKQKRIEKVVILGGGSAGWMTAAALSKVLPKLKIELVESEQIGTVGVGEATIPTIQFFNNLLGLNHHEFLSKTNGTFKLGINFENWHELGKDYFHAFGSTGRNLWAAGFHHFWRKGQAQSDSKPFGTYSFEAQAAKQGKFEMRDNGLNFAFHLDSSLYAKLLRERSEDQGVKRTEGKVFKVNQDPVSGFITSLELENANHIEGDLFVDCSGFSAVLIDKTLKSDFTDWSHWLPCDSAYAVQTENTGEPLPYTRSIAHQAGWRWQIPLQHRTGNGLVFSSQHMPDTEAKNLLLSSVEGKLLTEPRLLRFRTGYRPQIWKKNCVAIGLSGGFIEPLESTAIHLIQQGILRLIKLFPTDGIEQIEVDEYNLSAKIDYEQIRDFIVLHYHQTKRDDSTFWRYCRNMSIPYSLASRLALFAKNGQFIQRQEELFVDSWIQVMIGQGIIPEHYHRIADEMREAELVKFLNSIEQNIQNQVSSLSTHKHYIDRFCKALA